MGSQARCTVLFNSRNPKLKKNGDEDFDVPMGCYNVAEVCELAGTFMLNCLEHVTSKDVPGLYGDDGLSMIRQTRS